MNMGTNLELYTISAAVRAGWLAGWLADLCC